ncbi:MAG TPA: copper chaperone PCu(A)C [Gammaproteobacteria bacterium]
MNRLLPLCAAALALTAAAAQPLSVSNAWARATPPGAATAAAYLDIENTGPADSLVGVRSDAARAVEVHVMRHRNGMMQMERLEAVPVPPGEVTRLEPGGRHLMFIDITRPFAPGDTVTVTLLFANAGEIEVALPVRDARSPAR